MPSHIVLHVEDLFKLQPRFLCKESKALKHAVEGHDSGFAGPVSETFQDGKRVTTKNVKL